MLKKAALALVLLHLMLFALSVVISTKLSQTQNIDLSITTKDNQAFKSDLQYSGFTPAVLSGIQWQATIGAVNWMDRFYPNNAATVEVLLKRQILTLSDLYSNRQRYFIAFANDYYEAAAQQPQDSTQAINANFNALFAQAKKLYDSEFQPLEQTLISEVNAIPPSVKYDWTTTKGEQEIESTIKLLQKAYQ